MTTDLELLKQAQEILPENWEDIDEMVQQTDDEEVKEMLQEIRDAKYLLLEKEPQKRGKRIPNHYKRGVKTKSKQKQWK
jgi:hypothetical protein